MDSHCYQIDQEGDSYPKKERKENLRKKKKKIKARKMAKKKKDPHLEKVEMTKGYQVSSKLFLPPHNFR